MGDNIIMLAIRTRAEGSIFNPGSAKESQSQESAKTGLLTQIFQTITDTLKTWIYSSKKTFCESQITDLHTFRHSSYVGSGAITKLAEAINSEKGMVVDANGAHHLCSINFLSKREIDSLGSPWYLRGHGLVLPQTIL